MTGPARQRTGAALNCGLMGDETEKPFAEWSHAVECCRNFLAALFPGWRETYVDIRKDDHFSALTFTAVSTAGEPRGFTVSITDREISGDDETTAIIIARHFERLTHDPNLKVNGRRLG